MLSQCVGGVDLHPLKIEPGGGVGMWRGGPSALILLAHGFFFSLTTSPLSPLCTSESPRLTVRRVSDFMFYIHCIILYPSFSRQASLTINKRCAKSKKCHCLARLFDVLLQVKMMLNLNTWTSFCHLVHFPGAVTAFLWTPLIRDYFPAGMSGESN